MCMCVCVLISKKKILEGWTANYMVTPDIGLGKGGLSFFFLISTCLYYVTGNTLELYEADKALTHAEFN